MDISGFKVKFDSEYSVWVVIGSVSDTPNGLIIVADDERANALVKFADAVEHHRDHCIV